VTKTYSLRHLFLCRAPDKLDYPFHDRTVRVTQCGRICIAKRKISLSMVFAGGNIGISEVADNV